MSTDIALIEIKNPLELFSTANGLDSVIDKIEAEVMAVDRDISTATGRDNVRSLAAKVAKSKTALDKMGKELTEEQRALVTRVNAERSRAWDRLEALQHKVRQPLTDYENAEKDRVAAHERAIAELEALAVFDGKENSETVTSLLNDADVLLGLRDWEEFKARAERTHETVVKTLAEKAAALAKAEAEAAELARLRAAEQERLQKERDERIAAEAKEAAERKAKAAADALAAEVQAEQSASARREQEAKEQLIATQKAAAEAADKAERDRIAAVAAAEKAERDKIAAAQEAERKATEAREADKKHKAKINGEVLSAICQIDCDISEEHAKAIVIAIAQGKIPHVKISY